MSDQNEISPAQQGAILRSSHSEPISLSASDPPPDDALQKLESPGKPLAPTNVSDGKLSLSTFNVTMEDMGESPELGIWDLLGRRKSQNIGVQQINQIRSPGPRRQISVAEATGIYVQVEISEWKFGRWQGDNIDMPACLIILAVRFRPDASQLSKRRLFQRAAMEVVINDAPLRPYQTINDYCGPSINTISPVQWNGPAFTQLESKDRSFSLLPEAGVAGMNLGVGSVTIGTSTTVQRTTRSDVSGVKISDPADNHDRKARWFLQENELAATGLDNNYNFGLILVFPQSDTPTRFSMKLEMRGLLSKKHGGKQYEWGSDDDPVIFDPAVIPRPQAPGTGMQNFKELNLDEYIQVGRNSS